MDLELIRKLHNFNIYANMGFAFDAIDKYENYNIVYSNNIKDYWYNFISDIKVKNKKEFDKTIFEANEKMKSLNKHTAITILPLEDEIYNNKTLFFDNNYKLVSNEIWQIYDSFDKLDNIRTNCNFNIKLEKTDNMKLYSEEMYKAYNTGNLEDPYSNLDSIYKTVYSSYKKTNNKYITEFFFVKLNNKIVGVTEGVYDHEIYGIYGLAIKEEFRCKGIGKEVIKQQLKICKNNNLKIAFLQTEDGFYPANMYRKLGFKDVCTKFYYIKKQ